MSVQQKNGILLEHPSGVNVRLLGTQHVSSTHGSKAAAAVQRLQPSRVVLELDQARFQQVDFRFRHLMHQDTSSLMEMTADTGTDPGLLPDALSWGQHQLQFALMRNEGVPLLLGSLYGADFLQAALAASALPQQATLVLADQPQHVTMARFKALSDTLGQLRALLAGAFTAGSAQACTHTHPVQHQPTGSAGSCYPTAPKAPSCSGSNIGSTPVHSDPASLGLDLLQLQQVFTAAAQLAAGRMVHLALQWWSMALTSQARWYGDNVHPVFLLVGNTDLQQRLIARGCCGVPEAAAAAGRLLEFAAASGSSSSSSSTKSCGSSSWGGAMAAGSEQVRLPAVQDVLAIRKFVESLEGVLWCSAAGDANSTDPYATTSSRTDSNISSSSSNQVMHWLQHSTASASAEDAAGFSELLPLRPWWVTLSESFSHRLAQLVGCGSMVDAAAAAEGGVSLTSALQQHHHVNVTAAAAYDRAVMAERNSVLTAALWQSAAAAAAEEAEGAAAGLSSQQQRAAVVAVVGYNHVPGILQLWRRMQQQHAQEQQHQHHASSGGGSSSSASSGCTGDVLSGVRAPDGTFLPWQVTVTDALAGVLELAAAGGAGLAYWTAVNRWTSPGGAAGAAATTTAGQPLTATASSSSGSCSGWARLAARFRNGAGMQRLGLLLLPAAVALLPLERDAKRLQEAGGLLSRVAVVNDVILGQEAQQLQRLGAEQQQQQGPGAGSSIMQLAYKAQQAAAVATAAV